MLLFVVLSSIYHECDVGFVDSLHLSSALYVLHFLYSVCFCNHYLDPRHFTLFFPAPFQKTRISVISNMREQQVKRRNIFVLRRKLCFLKLEKVSDNGAFDLIKRVQIRKWIKSFENKDEKNLLFIFFFLLLYVDNCFCHELEMPLLLLQLIALNLSTEWSTDTL